MTALSLNDQAKFRVNETNKIKDYFNSEIQERETISKKLSKSIDYMDKVLIVLFATSGGVSIISHTSVIGIPAGIISSSFTLVFSNKKIIKRNKKKEEKHSKTIMLAKSQLNSIETLMSQALIDLDISHEEFKTIFNEKEKYHQMKEIIRNIKSRDEISENSGKIVAMHRFEKIIIFFFVNIYEWLLLLFGLIKNAEVHTITVKNKKIILGKNV